jgi:DNA-binding NarL/FixJ family response regulator
MKVFLVEDSPPIVARLMRLLGDVPGAEVSGNAATAQGAIDAIAADRPDLVLVDLQLAEGGGFDVLRALQPMTRDTEFYMLSSHASDPYRQLAERLGARGYFDKTRDMDKVRALVAARAHTTNAKGESSCLQSSC